MANENTTAAQGWMSAQQSLVHYWENSAKPRSVWALFDNDGSMLHWSTSKAKARGIMEKHYQRPLWMAKVQA